MDLGTSQRGHLSSSALSSSSEHQDPLAPAPGKRTLTMSLPPSRAAAEGGADVSPGTQQLLASSATVDAWLATAVRPDLFVDEPDAAPAAPIQRKASGEAAARAASPAPTTGGQPLPETVQARMSLAFSTDFSAVRVHQGPQAQAMGALAYAQGNDLFFAPGQYDPHSEKGQELIGHELAHTVQQAQGRVSATTQAKGQAINADASLEREADEMGARAARGENAAGGSGPAPSDATTPLASLPSAVAQPKAVVQRKVGFEFETGWFVDKIPFDYDHDDVEQPLQRPVPYAKKDVVSSAATKGFRLEADEAEDGRSELEIVVRPPVEESKVGLAELGMIMDDIAKIGEGLKAHYNGDGTAFPLSDVTGAPFDYFTAVTPRAGDPELKAGPQVTMGLDLAAVPKLNKVTPAILTDCPKLNGFVSLVKQYVGNGTKQGGAMSYPKMMAEPVLSRTDFVKLLDLVEPRIKQKYHQAPNSFVPDILKLAGLPQAVADEDMLARGVVDEKDQDAHTMLRVELLDYDHPYQVFTHELQQITGKVNDLTESVSNYKEPSGFGKVTSLFGPSKEDLERMLQQAVKAKLQLVEKYRPMMEKRNDLLRRKHALEKHAGFTVGRWLRQLLNGVDLLPTIRDAESLGEFGNKTEQVGPGEKIEGGIFEWRGDQKNKIPVTKWKDYALGKLTDAIRLNSGEG